MKSSLFLSIVGEGEAEKLMSVAKKAGCPGGTIVRGRGTDGCSLLALLLQPNVRREILLTLVFEQQREAVFEAIRSVKHVHGACVFLPSRRSYVNRTLGTTKGVQAVNNGWELIQVICNSGYAEDVMDVARKAGAGGGTIIDGRGTSKPDDLKFFGASLVPEKEVLLILVEREHAQRILEAVTAIPFLQEEGTGIAFSIPVDKFVQFGEK